MSRQRWERFQKYLCAPQGLDVRVDPSRMAIDDAFLERMTPALERAFDAMEALEGGAIANPDEGRMVGHYWLRDAARAPTPELRAAIDETLDRVRELAAGVRSGAVRPQSAGRFENALIVGIGGSALGPQFVSDALGRRPGGENPGGERPLRIFFLDNTDPDGFDRIFAEIDASPGGFAGTVTVVISKSGGTPETRNGMLEAANAYESRVLRFAPHAIAVTMEGSALDGIAVEQEWLARFPMWDWVGGRTSELSAVGLLPAALEGIDIDAMLEGARAMDVATRVRDPIANPAAVLALSWHLAGDGRGEKDMVILPYKDRLLLLSRYLQQLVMESLGKETDRRGELAEQGIVVYGNKGSTDQHAYIQQLRDGPENFFVTFIEVLEDRRGESIEVEPGVTAGDYLIGLHLGTRDALSEKGRGSVTITIPRVDATAVGKLIALFERAVGLYAELIDINAYHQPGVEAGKRAARGVLDLQGRVLADVEAHRGELRTAGEIAASIGDADEAETVFHLLEHRAANPGALVREAGESAVNARFGLR